MEVFCIFTAFNFLEILVKIIWHHILLTYLKIREFSNILQTAYYHTNALHNARLYSGRAAPSRERLTKI